jgi:hypothetical protein
MRAFSSAILVAVKRSLQAELYAVRRRRYRSRKAQLNGSGSVPLTSWSGRHGNRVKDGRATILDPESQEM